MNEQELKRFEEKEMLKKSDLEQKIQDEKAAMQKEKRRVEARREKETAEQVFLLIIGNCCLDYDCAGFLVLYRSGLIVLYYIGHLILRNLVIVVLLFTYLSHVFPCFLWHYLILD